jgi:hypothetical protein
VIGVENIRGWKSGNKHWPPSSGGGGVYNKWSHYFHADSRRYTSHAHFAGTPAEPIHYDSDATVKQGGQSDHTIRRATSSMTQIELSNTKVTRHPILKKPRLPPLIRQPMSQQWTSAIHARDLFFSAPGRCNWWTHSLKIKYLFI